MNQLDIPEGWELKTIAQICDVNPRKSEIANLPDDILVSFVPMKNVDDKQGVIKIRDERSLGVVRKGYTFFKNNDVIFAKITPCMENGKIAIGTNLQNGIGFASTEFHVLRPHDEVLPEWIHYFLRNTSFRNEAKNHFTGSAGQQRVPKDFLENHIIPIPKIDTQKKIVQKLDNILGKLEEKKKEIFSIINKSDIKKINSNYKNHLLKLAFNGSLTNEKLDNSKINKKYPSSWELKKLEDVCIKISSGGTPKRSNPKYFDGDIPWVKIGDLNNGIISKSEEKISKSGLKNSSAKLFPTNTVLFAMYGGQSYSSGITGITKIECTTNQAICGIVCDKKLDPHFLLYFLQSKVDEIRKLAEGGAQLNINQNKIKNFEILLPSITIQKKIVQILDKKLVEWEHHEKEIEKIERNHIATKRYVENLSSSILNSAFLGKLLN